MVLISPVVQRIEWEFPKLLIRVRFPAGLQFKKTYPGRLFCVPLSAILITNLCFLLKKGRSAFLPPTLDFFKIFISCLQTTPHLFRVLHQLYCEIIPNFYVEFV